MRMEDKVWTSGRDAQLRALYPVYSRKEIREIMGLREGQLRARCSALKLNTKRDAYWTLEEVRFLKEAYDGIEFSDELNLEKVSSDLGRHKTNVCRKARELGLTDLSRKGKRHRKIRIPKFKTKEELCAHISARTKKLFAEKGHPRGMLGKKHTPQVKEFISRFHTERAAKMTTKEKSAVALKAAKTREKNGTLFKGRERQTWGAGWREIGDIRKYYRSKWEANYARYLQWLKERGEILEWKHEPKTFWFEGIRRGAVCYLPDFWVKEKNGLEVYHEVKGWMDSRSQTKIKRMAKYYPEIPLIIIRQKEYSAIKKIMKPLLPDWEVDSKGR